MKSRTIVLSTIIFLFLLACTCSPLSMLQSDTQPPPVQQAPPAQQAQPAQEQAPAQAQPDPQQPQQQVQQPAGGPFLGEIIFCQDVTDDGVPIGPTTSFPAGTTEVWAFFTFENWQDGQPWGRVWYANGEVWVESHGDSWEDGPSGWLAYGISEDNPSIPLNGSYGLDLYIGDQLVRSATFTVASSQVQQSSGFPAFGAIQFAEGINDDIVPYGIAAEFPEGIAEVYAVFPYINMQAGQSFRREWLQDGEIIAEKDLAWEEGEQGTDYAFLWDEEGLSAGTYTLNLYLEGQVARSASFLIYAEAAPPTGYEGPAAPEDIIDSYMMPAWENLYYSHQEVLRDLAQWALDRHVQIYVDENYDGEAAYRHNCNEPPEIGEVIMSYDYWNNHSWEEVTSALGHELTHAVQHMTGDYRCGCSIEKEYYAWITQFYVLQEMGRMDILADTYGGVYDDYTGKFDGNKLWDVLKDVYSECPEY